MLINIDALVDKMSTVRTVKDDKQLLSEFNSLLKQNQSQECSRTGLLLCDALFYCLRACLLLQDKKWLFALCDIDNLKGINDKLGYNDADFVIETIGRIIKQFVDKKPSKTKGFRFDSNNDIIRGKGDLFGILIYAMKNENAERRLKLLMKQINNITNKTITIGVSTMQKNDNIKDWINRSLKCLEYIKTNSEMGGNEMYCNYSDKNETKTDENESKNAATTGNKSLSTEMEGILKTKQEFLVKGNEIADLEDNNWTLGLLDCDNMKHFNSENTREAADAEIEKVGIELARLALILAETCFVYKIGGDEFAFLFYNNNNNNKNKNNNNSLDNIDIISTLLDNIRSKCKITASIGFSNYNDETEEDFTEWQKRCEAYLKVSKDTGKNKAFWGQKLHGHNKESSLEKIEDIKEDDLILFKSLQNIEVLCLVFFVCVVCVLFCCSFGFVSVIISFVCLCCL